MAATGEEKIKDNVRVIVNSRNRNIGSASASNFTYNLNSSVERVQKVSVLSVQIPFTYYVINSNRNTIYINVAGGDVHASIPNGNYTSSTFASAIKTALDTLAGNPYTVTYSQVTMKLTISSAAAFSVLVAGAGNMAANMGFTAATGAGTSQVSDSVIDLSGSDYLVVKSTMLTKMAMVPSRTALALTTNNILYTIPVNASPAGIIMDSPFELKPIRYGYKQTFQNSIDFVLEDDQGNVMDLNGRNWSIHLLFETS